MGAAARPGTGGRRNGVDVGFEIEATHELRERYGDPEEIAHRGSRLLFWPMDPEGDGILAARLSGREVQKGETAMGQIHGGFALAATHGLKPACAVVAIRTSGRRRIRTPIGHPRSHRRGFPISRDPIRLILTRTEPKTRPDAAGACAIVAAVLVW